MRSVTALIVTFLGVFAPTIAVPAVESTVVFNKRDGGFDSCTSISLQNWTLTATCPEDNGVGNLTSSLDLDLCYANGAGGVLVCQPV